jgi:hypothetical protein
MTIAPPPTPTDPMTKPAIDLIRMSAIMFASIGIKA